VQYQGTAVIATGVDCKSNIQHPLWDIRGLSGYKGGGVVRKLNHGAWIPFDLLSDCPKNVQVTQSAAWNTSVAVLRCSAESHPPPSYVWTNAADKTTWEYETFSVLKEKYYNLTSTASNTVTHANGTKQTCSAQLSYEHSTCITKSDRTWDKQARLSLLVTPSAIDQERGILFDRFLYLFMSLFLC